MGSRKIGKHTSAVEITDISTHRFWILLDESELLLSFERFSWFKGANMGAILNVERYQPLHLYWPELDVDRKVASIEHPERYPLVAKPDG